jgi:hypothetical protein
VSVEYLDLAHHIAIAAAVTGLDLPALPVPMYAWFDYPYP